MIAIIDYDDGNIRSKKKAMKAQGEQPAVTRDKDNISAADPAGRVRLWLCHGSPASVRTGGRDSQRSKEGNTAPWHLSWTAASV